MDKLNTASYILTLRVGLKASKKEAAATLILGTTKTTSRIMAITRISLQKRSAVS